MAAQRLIIEGFEAVRVRIPRKGTYYHCAGTLKHYDGVVVKIHAGGLTGLGELSMLFPDRTGTTPGTALDIFKNYVAPRLLGQDALAMRNTWSNLVKLGSDAHAFPYHRAAVDVAVHDLAAKALGVPVHQLLGEEPNGSPEGGMTVGRSISTAGGSLVPTALDYLANDNYASFTIKGSDNVDEDVERFKELREVLGPDFPLEVDPNQAYTADEAMRLVKALDNHNLAVLEQPCAWWDMETSAQVQAAAKDVPVVVDEGAIFPWEIRRVAQMKAGRGITLKVARGGFTGCSLNYKTALEHGLFCNVGSKHTMGVGTAAIAHFCAAHPGVYQPIGYGSPRERFVDDIIKGGINFQKGRLYVPEGPGLGVELDEAKLLEYRVGHPLTVGLVRNPLDLSNSIPLPTAGPKMWPAQLHV
ncbi:unnamed protein product [Symbiodinium pilosum]|uniref:Mandelate racemase/muconate lactonizing enzyme C-terminal domain-containing protein n=1 Tax=Symbiodinium pilosum TaxID=2952 RepID=A0A812YP53_SYMPI|nr:unnamed protein product [Symbiodinium pilosum]